MIKKVKFGECLHLLLSALDISNHRLSKGINVDASLISRWLHNQRVPPYHSNYLEDISSFLSRSILNSFQEQRLSEVLNVICSDSDVVLAKKDRILKALLDSQGYSLEDKETKTDRKKISSRTMQRINLSPENCIIIGHKNVVSAMLALIRKAAKATCKSNHVIYMSFGNGINPEMSLDDFIYWRDLVLMVLKNGYTVKFLFKLNQNLNNTIALIKFAKPLIETGHFLPYYYKAYDLSELDSATIIIPDIGAINCLSTSPKSVIDSAFYIENEVGIDILTKNFNAFLFISFKSLFKYFASDENSEYYGSVTESQERSGNQFLFKDSLCQLTIPNVLLTRLLEKQQLTDYQLIKALELHKLSLETFYSNLQHYEHFNIYTLNSFQKMIENKQLSFALHDTVYIFDLEIGDIIILIQNLIYLIQTFDNYKFALVNETPYKNEKDIFYSFVIKEKHKVHIEYSNLRASIEEPMIVNALEKYFEETWKQLAPVDKNIVEIVKWLQHQIDVLKKQLS